MMTTENGSSNANEAPVAPSYRHTFRLFVLIVIIAMAALVMRQILVPELTSGKHGSFRLEALDEARAFTPRHVGEKVCADCHDEEVELHDKDVHATVPCESCHGPGWKHAESPEKSAVLIPEGKESCLVCHRQLDARPGAFPQIKWRDHYRFVGVEDESVNCAMCHNPHEPLFMDRDFRQARLHPLIHRCRDCHVGRIEQDQPRPAKHPEIFECSYCHKEVVDDFSARPHSKVQCTTCHLFIKETEFSGRIIRDSDPRFCLLCHREAGFRSSDAPPGIEWPEHLEDVSFGPEDAEKRCIDCHRDRIHNPGRIES